MTLILGVYSPLSIAAMPPVPAVVQPDGLVAELGTGDQVEPVGLGDVVQGQHLSLSRSRSVRTSISDGLSNEEIGTELFISVATARTDVSRAMTELSARDRAQLVAAYESRLVTPGQRQTRRGSRPLKPAR